MDYLVEFLVSLGLGGLLGIAFAWGNNRLFLQREGGEPMRAPAFVIFPMLGLGVAGVIAIERGYKGLFDEMIEEVRPPVYAGLLVAGLDPARLPVGEVGRVLQEMDDALQREIQRADASWFIEFMEPWSFSEYVEQTRAFAAFLRRVDVIDVEEVFRFSRDASFVYFFPWAGTATWAVLILFPFFAGLLRMSVR